MEFAVEETMVFRKATEFRWPALGFCLYCDATGLLTDEHIIPTALNGPWVLPKSSCMTCQRTIAPTENDVLRNALLQIRTGGGLHTRDPQGRPRDFAVTAVYANGSRKEFRLSAADHPSVMILPVFTEPEFIGGPQVTGIGLTSRRVNIQLQSPVKTAAILSRLGAIRFESQLLFDPVALARLVAKIAHGMSVASLGRSALTRQFLPDVILGRHRAGEFVGSVMPQPPAPSSALHRVVIQVHRGLIVARVRLLARWFAPEYIVVVGRTNVPDNRFDYRASVDPDGRVTPTVGGA